MPDVAYEITLPPVHRFGLDAAVVFADIMTPLEAMGVDVTYGPGPHLGPRRPEEVAALGEPDVDRIDFVAATIARVRATLPGDVAVVGFASGPVTLLASLREGGGSRDFMTMRAALVREPETCRAALEVLADAMRVYLERQVVAGTDVV